MLDHLGDGRRRPALGHESEGGASALPQLRDGDRLLGAEELDELVGHAEEFGHLLQRETLRLHSAIGIRRVKSRSVYRRNPPSVRPKA
ncbi:hypothetical protein [Sinomonas terrae]|uniref:Transposase n=1 Tax=Sinomonas terrae TaxID=2908838 RepID=A0ABS9U0R4_9MICC|nr:hypothetical protein [Sinomonas terrae]MCH6470186.1 hypothetical protein [Sinomonas terrae]